eukprot:1454905-Rhodomonas_salina.3
MAEQAESRMGIRTCVTKIPTFLPQSFMTWSHGARRQSRASHSARWPIITENLSSDHRSFSPTSSAASSVLDLLRFSTEIGSL